MKELASRVLRPTTMSFHRLKLVGYLKKTMDYCLAGEDYLKEKATGAGKHSPTQTGVEAKATESQRQEDSMH